MRNRILLALIGVFFVAGMATGAATPLIGTPHDLSSNITSGPAQICAFCHTPHNSNQQLGLNGNAPLWNHQVNSGQDYGVYTSPTMDATGPEITSISATDTSGLCMGCHDGTLSPGALFNQPNNSSPGGEESLGSIAAITGNANLGTDLTNDHPVNFLYTDSTESDSELVATPPAGYLDGNGRVQCASCHDPHVPGPDTAKGLTFMRDTMEQSTLCTNCHIK